MTVSEDVGYVTVSAAIFGEFSVAISVTISFSGTATHNAGISILVDSYIIIKLVYVCRFHLDFIPNNNIRSRRKIYT